MLHFIHEYNDRVDFGHGLRRKPFGRAEYNRTIFFDAPLDAL
jgi:hypothetical protein